MKFLVIGDVHLADRGPRSRTLNYRSLIEDKLRFCIDLANDEKVDAVLQLGDFFHIKTPNRNSHAMVQEAAKILARANCPVIINPGNHCLTNNRIESIPSQPLGTLGLHPNIEILIGPHANFPIWGQPYFDLSPDNYKYWLDRYHADSGPDVYPILMAHNSIFPEKEIPPYDNVSAEVWAETFKAPYTFYGHIHEPMDAGWNYQIGGTHFLNNGSISRGSLAERNLVRKPQVTIFDDSKNGNPFTSVEVPHLPASEVFFLAESILAKEQQASVDEFLSTLEGGELSYLTTESILEDARNRNNITKDALAILEDIVETVA